MKLSYLKIKMEGEVYQSLILGYPNIISYEAIVILKIYSGLFFSKNINSHFKTM